MKRSRPVLSGVSDSSALSGPLLLGLHYRDESDYRTRPSTNGVAPGGRGARILLAALFSVPFGVIRPKHRLYARNDKAYAERDYFAKRDAFCAVKRLCPVEPPVFFTSARRNLNVHTAVVHGADPFVGARANYVCGRKRYVL